MKSLVLAICALVLRVEAMPKLDKILTEKEFVPGMSQSVSEKSYSGILVNELIGSESEVFNSDGERHGGRNRVYCDYYRKNGVHGYSIYRRSDQMDIGNAVWSNDNECIDSARLANHKRENIVCAKFYNKRSGDTDYSVYRISDGVDLGNSVITNFEDCQASVRSARDGIFCSTYVKDGRTYWSMYDVETGKDLGNNLYYSLDQCSEKY